MEKKCVSVRISDMERRKIRAVATEGETISATMRRLVFGQHAQEKEAIQEWANLIFRLEKATIEGETVGAKIDRLDQKIAAIFGALEKQMTAIAGAQNEGGGVDKKWQMEIEQTLAMLRQISQWIVAGSPSATAQARKNPDIEKFLT